MRGKVDENMPIESAGVLRAAGWDCETVFDEALVGAEDPDVGARCQAEGRVLFTLDMDFADIRAYPPSAYIGIVVFRPMKPSGTREKALGIRGLTELASRGPPRPSQRSPVAGTGIPGAAYGRPPAAEQIGNAPVQHAEGEAKFWIEPAVERHGLIAWREAPPPPLDRGPWWRG